MIFGHFRSVMLNRSNDFSSSRLHFRFFDSICFTYSFLGNVPLSRAVARVKWELWSLLGEEMSKIQALVMANLTSLALGVVKRGPGML